MLIISGLLLLLRWAMWFMGLLRSIHSGSSRPMRQIGVRNSIVLASFSSNFLAMVHVRWNDNSLTSTVLKHWLIKLTVDSIIKPGCYRFLVKQMGVVTAHMIVDSMNTMYVTLAVIRIFSDFFRICYDMSEGDVIE